MSDQENLDNPYFTNDVGSVDYMLTTVDNPFSPFTQFDEWMVFDTSHGYHTLSILARVVITSDDLSEADQQQAIQLGIEEMVKENASGLYRRVTQESFAA